MNFKTFFEKKGYPFVFKKMKGVYGEMKIWINEKTDTNELFIEFDGETQLKKEQIPELIDTLKKLQREL